jgi:CDP-diglyceride synthetase
MWFIMSIAGSAIVCASSWFALARWARISPRSRTALAIFLPLAIGGLLLWLDGALFNGVATAMFFLPLVVVNWLVVLVLNAFSPLDV